MPASSARYSALLLLLAACGDGGSTAPSSSAPELDASAKPDASSSPPSPARDGGLREDAGPIALQGRDAGQSETPRPDDAGRVAPPLARDAALATDAAMLTVMGDSGGNSGGDSGSGCAACAVHEVCDIQTARCVDPVQPYQLDCANLAASAPCLGGPNEVLLATNTSGGILMLDPKDGHYLGHLKREDETLPYQYYRYATQGPDQCIWSVARIDDEPSESAPAQLRARAVERWNTDGSFKDHVIPLGKHYRDGVEDRLLEAQTLAFTREHVYVAADERVTRFKLDGSFVDEVWPFEARTLLAAGDGSLFVSQGETVVQVRGKQPTTLVSGLYPRQLWYAGKGELLVGSDTLPRPQGAVSLNLQTGVASALAGTETDAVEGIAPLGSGELLLSMGGDDVLAALDPKFTPRGKLRVLTESAGAVQQIGRACVPDAVLRVPAPDPALAETECGAPAGKSVFSEDFELGELTATAYKQWKVYAIEDEDEDETVQVARSDGALQVTGGRRIHGAAITHALPGVRPSYISYRMKVSTTAGGWRGYLSLEDADSRWSLALVYNDGAVLTAAGGVVKEPSAPLKADTWVTVQLRDFDWTRRTYDVYVDCKRIGDDLHFGGGNKVDKIALYNFHEGSTSSFDDIVILE